MSAAAAKRHAVWPAAPSRSPTTEKAGEDERPVHLGPREIGCHRPRDRQATPGARSPGRAPAARSRRREAGHGRRERGRSSRRQRQGRRPPSTPSRPRRRRRAASRSRPTPPLRASASRAKLACDAGRPCLPYPQGLTNRLRAAHPGINAVRKTLHTALASVRRLQNDHDLDDPHSPPPDDRTRARRARGGRGLGRRAARCGAGERRRRPAGAR